MILLSLFHHHLPVITHWSTPLTLTHSTTAYPQLFASISLLPRLHACHCDVTSPTSHHRPHLFNRQLHPYSYTTSVVRLKERIDSRDLCPVEALRRKRRDTQTMSSRRCSSRLSGGQEEKEYAQELGNVRGRSLCGGMHVRPVSRSCLEFAGSVPVLSLFPSSFFEIIKPSHRTRSTL